MSLVNDLLRTGQLQSVEAGRRRIITWHHLAEFLRIPVTFRQGDSGSLSGSLPTRSLERAEGVPSGFLLVDGQKGLPQTHADHGQLHPEKRKVGGSAPPLTTCYLRKRALGCWRSRSGLRPACVLTLSLWA